MKKSQRLLSSSDKEEEEDDEEGQIFEKGEIIDDNTSDDRC
jgi:hypothetical protein